MAAAHMKEPRKPPAKSPTSNSFAEALACLALAMWVFGRIVFLHTTIGLHPGVVARNPMAWIQAAAFGCAIAAIASRKLQADALGMVILGLLFVTSFSVWRRLQDPNLLAFSILLAASRGIRFKKLALFGVGAIVVATLLVAMTRILPMSMLGTRFAMLANMHFVNKQVVPQLIFCSLASLALIVRSRRMDGLLAICCVACSILFVVRYSTRRYAALVLLLGILLAVYVIAPSRIESLNNKAFVRLGMALAPPLLCCAVYDLVTFHGLNTMGIGANAYVSFLQTYGLLPLLLVLALYSRTVLAVDTEPEAFVLLSVFTLFAIALAFDANAMFIEMNLPLLILSEGLGTSAEVSVDA